MTPKGDKKMSGESIFLIIGFLFFVGTVIVYLRNDNSDGAVALEKVKSVDTSVQAVDSHLVELKQMLEDQKGINRIQKAETNAILEKYKAEADELKKKIDWLEMKATIPTTKIVQAPPMGPMKIEPITINVVHTYAKKKKPLLPGQKADGTDPVTQKVIDAVKAKVGNGAHP